MCVPLVSAWYFFLMLPVRVLGMVVLSGVLGFPGILGVSGWVPRVRICAWAVLLLMFWSIFGIEGTRAPPGDDF